MVFDQADAIRCVDADSRMTPISRRMSQCAADPSCLDGSAQTVQDRSQIGSFAGP
ncbi:hypothetical protein KIN20_000917 [Parelaphostrongylus tenuis]|uniref:Uncharacterized protein n=1 Tax=Parelaphostrongylus tenuis TaxID=148309 RepID=A0AAD5MC18_PARTN|nr:hypothetical protein KIN20_000917 [Parelaphostrongylus tenuis]